MKIPKRLRQVTSRGTRKLGVLSISAVCTLSSIPLPLCCVRIHVGKSPPFLIGFLPLVTKPRKSFGAF